MADETETTDATSGPGIAQQEAAATGAADDTILTVGVGFLNDRSEAGDADTDADADAWTEGRTTEDGVAIDAGGLPYNLRLRSLALADRGEAEDPDGLVSPELIADAKARAESYDADYPAITGKTTTAQLESMAKAEGVNLDGATTNEERAQRILAARPARV